MCNFKIEISDKHNIVSQQLQIEADLLYADISGLGGWDGLEFHLDQVLHFIRFVLLWN
jgi:hypothetical protein